MATDKKLAGIVIGLGPPHRGMGHDEGPEDDGPGDDDGPGYKHSDMLLRASQKFFSAAGIAPEDEAAACHALKAFVSICVDQMDIGEEEEEEGEHKKDEGEEERDGGGY